MALDFRRGRSAKERLQVDWTHPVWKPKPKASGATAGSTVAVEVERALPAAEAYAWITEGDHRPLLILRECDRCKGTDHALLSRTLDNEQTVLLTHWFRCVKLPTNVLGKEHPFTNLFARDKDGERIPHLFFCDPDGSHKAELPGDQPQTQLWATMFDFLDRCYTGDAKKAIKEMRSILTQFDRLDAAEDDLLARLDQELDRNGDSGKAAKYRTELDKLKAERSALVEKEKKIRGLALAALNAPAAAGSEQEAPEKSAAK